MKYKVSFDLNGAKFPQFVEKGNMKLDVEVEMTAEEFIETMGRVKELVTFVTKEFKEIHKANLEREIRDLKEKLKNKEDEDDDPLN